MQQSSEHAAEETSNGAIAGPEDITENSDSASKSDASDYEKIDTGDVPEHDTVVDTEETIRNDASDDEDEQSEAESESSV